MSTLSLSTGQPTIGATPLALFVQRALAVADA